MKLIKEVLKRLNFWWLTSGWVLEIAVPIVEKGGRDTRRLPGQPHLSAIEEIDEILARRRRVALALSVAGWVAVGLVSTAVMFIAMKPGDLVPIIVGAGIGWTAICFLGEDIKGRRNMKLRRLRSGARAESNVGAALHQIFGDSRVLQNFEIANARSRTGTTEFDYVVIGRKAIYLVEVKSVTDAKTIVGREDGWEIRVHGKGQEPMRDPVRQVAIQRTVLGKALDKAGLKGVRIKPIVMLAARYTDIQLSEDEVIPVFVSDNGMMLNYIEQQESSSGRDLPASIGETIRELMV